MKQPVQYMTAKKWIILSTINFLIVAVFGLLMRLKFLFPLSFLDQKNLMHAHSHFAFSGWVSQSIMIFMVLMVTRKNINECLPKNYQAILLANLIGSIGMLFTFTWTGYAFPSIAFSFCVVMVSYWFTFVIWKDLNKSNLPKSILLLFKAALIYGILSSFGTYGLVYLKITHQLDPLKQLASIYFYLHFQYNGWFFFSCLGLANYWIYTNTGRAIISDRFSWIYALTVVPAYFLSVLWWKEFPNWLYAILLITVFLQIVLWISFLIKLNSAKRNNPSIQLSALVKLLWICVLIAVSLKLILQAVSTIPSLSQFIYGFRPVVIAYLHLVLLVIISLFLLGYSFVSNGLVINKAVKIAIYGLLIGILLNEIMLMIQGIAGLLRISFHGTHETLAFAALLIVISLCVIIHKQKSRFITKNNHGG